MIQSAEINHIAAALAAAQGKFETVVKEKTVNMTLRTGGRISFKYADLAAVIAAIRPALSENGIAILQTIEPAEGGKGYSLRTMLAHASGQFIGSEVTLAPWSDPKTFAVELTYMRRYALSALVGVASDDDTDGNSEESAGPQEDKPRIEPPRARDEVRREPEPDGESPAPERSGQAGGGEPATDGERKFIRGKLERLNLTPPDGIDLDALTKAQFAALKEWIRERA